MKALRALLLLILVAELGGIGYFAARRIAVPAPPEFDLSGMDSLTAGDLRRLSNDAARGGSPEWKALAQALLGQGYYNESEQCFRVACTLDPADQEAVYGLGFCLERVGRVPQAIETLERAAGMSNDELSQTCRYQIGRCHLRLEDPQAAEADFREIAEMPAAAYQLAKILIRTDRVNEAVPLLDEQLAAIPQSHKLLQLRALAAEMLGDDETAAECRDGVLRAPAGISVDYGMSFIGLYRGRHGLDRRLTECTRLKQNGRPADHAACLGEVLTLVRKESLKQYDKLYIAAAEAEMANQQPDRALAVLDELQQFEHPGPGALELRGDALRLRGDVEGAYDLWQRVAAMSPNITVHGKLAEHAAQLGDEPSAAVHRAAAHQLTGMRAFRENRLDDAYRAFQDALQAGPHTARTWYYLGETYRLRGMRPRAESAYRRCLELDDNYQRARVALERIAQ